MHVHDVKIDDEPSCAASNRFSCRILLKIVDTKDNNISDLVNTCVFHNYTETFHGRGNTPMNFFSEVVLLRDSAEQISTHHQHRLSNY